MFKTCEERPTRVKTGRVVPRRGAKAPPTAWPNEFNTCEERPTTAKTGQSWAKKMIRNVIRTCEERQTRVKTGHSWAKKGRKGVANGVVKRAQNV